MPVNEKIMGNLKDEYGEKKGESVYYAMENEGKIKPASKMQKTIETYKVARKAVEKPKEGVLGILQKFGIKVASPPQEGEKFNTKVAKSKITLQSLGKAWKLKKAVYSNENLKEKPKRTDVDAVYEANRKIGLGEEYKKHLSKMGIGSAPSDQKKSIDPKLKAYAPKMAKWGKVTKACLKAAYSKMKKSELEEGTAHEAQEHGMAEPEAMKTAQEHLAEDPLYYKKLKRMEDSTEKDKLETGSSPPPASAQHALAPTDYAIIEAKFLKEGTYPAKTGQKCKYTWATLEKSKDTFKGRAFYLDHPNEKVGMEYGVIDDVDGRELDGENWLVATIRVPEADFTNDVLGRIETGLIKQVSASHEMFINLQDPENTVTRITGRGIAAVKQAQIGGAEIISIKRHAAG